MIESIDVFWPRITGDKDFFESDSLSCCGPASGATRRCGVLHKMLVKMKKKKNKNPEGLAVLCINGIQKNNVLLCLFFFFKPV